MKPLAVSGGCCGSRMAEATTALQVPAEVRDEAGLIRLVESGRGDSAFTRTFLELLDERHAVYRGVGTPAVTRMRAALLLALGYRALPVTALPFVLEELESAHDAWLTAVAAHVLRKYPEPSASFAEPLLSAILYIQHRDEIVRLANYGGYGPGGETTTAMGEIMQAIGWLGREGTACVPRLEELLAGNPGPATSGMVRKALEAIRADDRAPIRSHSCCSGEATAAPAPSGHMRDISSLRFQDHSGAELTFADAFHGRPSIVVFFYTRCDNPAKCPLTMYRFGSLQRLLQQSGLHDAIGMAAITYDPEYDRSERLLQYAESWGAKPSSQHRILRTVGDFDALSDYFSLGVNFSASGIVNRHQLEAFVLDADGRIAHTVSRRRWDEETLMRLAAPLARDRPTG
jgi:protein SCO1/2